MVRYGSEAKCWRSAYHALWPKGFCCPARTNRGRSTFQPHDHLPQRAFGHQTLRQAFEQWRSEYFELFHAGDRVRAADSQAGMHVLAWLPDYDHAQPDELIRHAHERGLGLYPVTPCHHGKPPVPGLILGYCGLPEAELREAMRLFGACLDSVDASRAEAA